MKVILKYILAIAILNGVMAFGQKGKVISVSKQYENYACIF